MPVKKRKKKPVKLEPILRLKELDLQAVRGREFVRILDKLIEDIYKILNDFKERIK